MRQVVLPHDGQEGMALLVAEAGCVLPPTWTTFSHPPAGFGRPPPVLAASRLSGNKATAMPQLLHKKRREAGVSDVSTCCVAMF